MQAPATALPLPRAGSLPRAAAQGGAPSHEIPPEQVSALLWTACRLDQRGSDGHSADRLAFGHVQIHVLRADGAFRYDPRGHQLLLENPADLRMRLPAGHEPAPLQLAFVTGANGDQDASEECGVLAGGDVTSMARSVAEQSGAAGLLAGPIHDPDPRLAKALGLRRGERVVLLQAISRPAIPCSPAT